MPRFFLPFPLGATVPAIVEPPPPPPFWVPVTAGSLNWNGVRAGLMPRFEHIYPQESGGEQQFNKVDLGNESEG